MRIFVFYTAILLLLCGCYNSHEVEEPIHAEVADILADSCGASVYDLPGTDAPDGGCVPLRVRWPGRTFGKVFNDSNYRHLQYARAAGIVPPDERRDIWHTGAGVVRVRSNKYIYIDSLKHSYPYLMPHAADLLNEIGRRFADSLAAHGGGDYRLKVTSLLRTPMTVGKLRRVNRNATAESAHRYATTFDISYSKFIYDGGIGPARTFDDLKVLLARIVYDLRAEGRCLVKHERKQACFHITAAPPDSI